jgi:Methyltransferase domain
MLIMDDSFYLSAASFSEAEYRSESYHWLGHIPFAFWIVEATQPDLIVELGTRTGNSYFSFCQAVRQLGLGTRCCAVDTWAGDLHSGYSGEKTYERVSEINRRKYLPFSRLIRSTFDEALPQFQDRSIDMLHFNEIYQYDDVKYEFESWSPKLSDRAVVLLHDTSKKESGVFRYFHELSQNFPAFQFLHCGGLGVVGIGRRLPDRVARLLEVAEGGPQCRTIRRCYSRLGQRIWEALVRDGMETTINGLPEELTGAHARFSKSHRSLSDSRHQSTERWSRLESTQVRVTAIAETDPALAAKTTALTAEKAALTAENTGLIARITALLAEMAALAVEKTELNGEIAALTGANTTLASAMAGLAEEKAALTTAKIAYTTAMAALKDLNAKLNAKNAHMSRENVDLSIGNAALAAERDQLGEQVFRIQESLSWRVIHKCKAIRKRTLREGTISERCWILFSRFAKTAISQGLYAACQSAARNIKDKSADFAWRGTQTVIAGYKRRSQSAGRFLGLARRQGISTALGRAANTGQNTIEVEAGDSI